MNKEQRAEKLAEEYEKLAKPETSWRIVRIKSYLAGYAQGTKDAEEMVAIAESALEQYEYAAPPGKFITTEKLTEAGKALARIRALKEVKPGLGVEKKA